MPLRTLWIAATLAAALAGCTNTTALNRQADATMAAWHERDAYLNAVRVMLRKGKAQAAMAFLDDYARHYPNDPEARLLRGEALVRIGDADGAEALYMALYQEGKRPEADFGLGQAYALKGDWWRALVRFKEASDMAPSNARYLNNYGYALLKNGKTKLGYTMLARAFEIDPKNVQTRNNYILAAHIAGRRREAMRVLASVPSEELDGVMEMLSSWKVRG